MKMGALFLFLFSLSLTTLADPLNLPDKVEDLKISPLSVIFSEVNVTNIPPIPESLPHSEDKAKLGKSLFFDPVLSVNNTISCASCHNLARLGGANGTKVSIGVFGKSGTLNAPTVFNSVFNISQFWDGRSPNLQEQAKSPIFTPHEMGFSSWTELEAALIKQNKYLEDFTRLYETGLTLDNLTNAIAEFEKTLITPNSRFDRFLKGNFSALTPKEKEGYQLFQNFGCISCHNGINIGGNIFQKAGVFEPFNSEDSHLWFGRYNITKDPADKFFVKVPSLRNIALTAPYFHDGTVPSLKEAIELMIKHQLGKTATDEEVELLEAFLGSLTGEYQGKPLEKNH